MNLHCVLELLNGLTLCIFRAFRGIYTCIFECFWVHLHKVFLLLLDGFTVTVLVL